MRTWTRVAMFSISLLASCSTGAGTPVTESPADSPTPVVRVLPECHEESCEGPLEIGAYRAPFVEPAVEFEITSPGWSWRYSGSLAIVADPFHEDLYAADGIYFLRDPAIASQDCEEKPEPGIGRSVDDLVEWIEAAPGLAVTEPVPVTVDGLDGMRLDIELDPAWTRPCFFSQDMPAVPLIFNGARIGGYNWAALPDQSMRWYVLDPGDGVLVVDIEDGPGGASRDDLFLTGTEIVDSLTFEVEG